MQRMIAVMIGFLFPISLLTHRRDDEMELFLATVLTAQGILQLRERRQHEMGQKNHLYDSGSCSYHACCPGPVK